MRTTDLFDLDHTIASSYLAGFEHPWDAIKGISDFILETGPKLDPAEYDMVAENVWVHKTASVFASASITGPVIIGPNSHVYHCAIVRTKYRAWFQHIYASASGFFFHKGPEP